MISVESNEEEEEELCVKDTPITSKICAFCVTWPPIKVLIMLQLEIALSKIDGRKRKAPGLPGKFGATLGRQCLTPIPHGPVLGFAS